MRSGWVVAAVLAALPVHAADNGPARFALVVGNNQGPPDLPVLQYADDDAARLEELLAAAGFRTRLLTVLDPETQALMPSVVARSRPPTREELLSALAQLQEEMRAERTAGRTVEFTFAFAGHGLGSPGSGGAIFLLDGPFTRQDLLDLVVRPSPADFNHVVIDACDSYFMVASRGASEYPDDRVSTDRTEDVVRAYLGGDGLLNDPRTGFLVSTNQAAQSHEYGGFRAGVFSHVVHSALVGAADANGDGVIEYTEVLAYAAAASQEIQDPRARLAIFGRAPPQDVHRPLLDLRHSNFSHYLRLGPELEGRIHVEDARTVRYADVNKPRGSEVLLALVDSAAYRVVKADGEANVKLVASRHGAVRVGAFAPLGTAARGAPDTPLRQELFAVPYDASFYRGYVASRGLSAAQPRGPFLPQETGRSSLVPGRPRFIFAVPGLFTLGGGGLLGMAAGLTTLITKLAYDDYAKTLREDGVANAQKADRINQLRVLTGLLVAAGVGCLALGGILVAVELLWPVRSGEAP